MVTIKARQWRRSFRLGWFLWAAAGWLALAPAAQAALQFDVLVGFNGMVPQSAWFPITCELHNDGPSFQAIIEVVPERFAQAQTRRLAVELPTNTRKRVVIPVFASSRYTEWNVRLLDERGKVRAEPNYIGSSRRVAGEPRIGAICRTVAGLPVLPPIKPRQPDHQPSAVRLQPELFPDNPLALEGLPLIYLNSEKAASLTVPQANALMAWLQNGGHLVVGVEQATDLAAAGWLRNLLPCDLAATTVLPSHGELHDWVNELKLAKPAGSPKSRKPKASAPAAQSESPGNLTEDDEFEAAPLPVLTGAMRDGKVIVGKAETPLVIQAQRGRGRLTLLTFSPEREPFLS